ncbi:DUF5819 family protein [Streptacidiphilus sp. P02-A3a]|uniref:DUF5819 family protein n=1 Tax=Streptacidiphilus sp. P02-A3a TaxID=2704468 RepID=UPI0015F9AFF6|nr:DUF5819 family protein [Streptacidiphilus sp. P02-A3a]QMU67639.1 hypothetical protein GXP74_04755 [Streptacidiphilus sp. P02-A3a]
MSYGEAEQPDPTEPDRPEPVRLSRWSKAVLAVVALLVSAVTAVHLTAIFFDAAPPNTVSQRYATELRWWTQPWLAQNWKLFAPDPQSTNTDISARVRSADGAVSPWVDLTAIDYAAVRHDPMPSHANENELRMAWNSYTGSQPGSSLQLMLQQYLVNIVLQRVPGTGPGPFSGVQLRVTNTPLEPPGHAAPVADAPQTLPWWTLRSQEGSAK